jgi:hypothetical protein
MLSQLPTAFFSDDVFVHQLANRPNSKANTRKKSEYAQVSVCTGWANRHACPIVPVLCVAILLVSGRVVPTFPRHVRDLNV